jgi:hypothetical protein
MSRYTFVGLNVLSAALITLWFSEGKFGMIIFAFLLTFLSGFLIGGGVGLKEGRLEREYK